MEISLKCGNFSKHVNTIYDTTKFYVHQKLTGR